MSDDHAEMERRLLAVMDEDDAMTALQVLGPWLAAADDYDEPPEMVLEDDAYTCPRCGTTIGHDQGCTA